MVNNYTIIGTLVLFLGLLKFLQTYKSCFYNYTLFAYQNVVLRSNGDWTGFPFWIFCILGLLKDFGGGLKLTENWACNILKYMNWSNRKSTTGKVESSKKFLEEEKFTFQSKISNALQIPDSHYKKKYSKWAHNCSFWVFFYLSL